MYDIALIGGGIVGLASARALIRRFGHKRIVLFEKEARLGSHQTGHNSGVIHSGIYYAPGSLKAKLCVDGVRRLTEFCQARGIEIHRCGKVIVAADKSEYPALDALYERGRANGVGHLERIGRERLRELEPNVRGVRAIHLPDVGIVDFGAVMHALSDEFLKAGGRIHMGTRVKALVFENNAWRLCTSTGVFHAQRIVNCGGLHVDRIGRMAGDANHTRIVPFRGEYYTLPMARASLINGLVYPVPDPALPFLGIHFTKMLEGGVHVGPNAVLALKREGYKRTDVSVRDCLELALSPGFWRMAARYWKVGLDEMSRSLNKRLFLQQARRLVPSLALEDLVTSPAGVRAQAIDPDGSLLQDFAISESRGAIHIYNAPSPAATASLTIGDYISERINE